MRPVLLLTCVGVIVVGNLVEIDAARIPRGSDTYSMEFGEDLSRNVNRGGRDSHLVGHNDPEERKERKRKNKEWAKILNNITAHVGKNAASQSQALANLIQKASRNLTTEMYEIFDSSDEDDVPLAKLFSKFPSVLGKTGGNFLSKSFKIVNHYMRNTTGYILDTLRNRTGDLQTETDVTRNGNKRYRKSHYLDRWGDFFGAASRNFVNIFKDWDADN